MRRAVYAGSFDPITLGHLWMVERGAELFDELIVAIGVNPDKRYPFPLADRLAMLRETTGHPPAVRVGEGASTRRREPAVAAGRTGWGDT